MHYLTSHRTISLPGFMENKSKNKDKNTNQNNANVENDQSINNNINNSAIQNNKNKNNKSRTKKTKSDLTNENLHKSTKNTNNNHNNLDMNENIVTVNKFNKNMSAYKLANNKITLNNNSITNTTDINKNISNNINNNIAIELNDQKQKITEEKCESFKIGQIYTDEEENNLIEDLDEEELTNSNCKNNNNTNILINDSSSIITNEKEKEKDKTKKEKVNKFSTNKSSQRPSNKNESSYFNINNTSSSYKKNNNTNNIAFDDTNSKIIKHFDFNDSENNTNDIKDNNSIQKNDVENEYFNNVDENSESNDYDSEDNNNLNSREKVGPSNFICLALLGQGSFGEVYLVQEKNTFNYYAMKVLDKKRIEKQNIFKYAMTERNVLSIINFPFIVKLNYAFQTKEKLFLLLDYCPGGDLSKQLQIQTRFGEEKAKFYICEIALALGELHKKDIIFRDLKPDNIVIDKEGHAMLTDFGLSREGVNEKHIAKSFCGSIAYLAPEMLSRKGHGKAVDWYLLGVCFYEMLVGIPPYFSNNQEQIFKNIEKADLYIPNFVSKKAQKFLRDLLKKDPSNRLGTKRDVEEIKEHPYMAEVDWDKVLKRQYIPPPIIQKSNYLNFFEQPKIFVDYNKNKDVENYNRNINQVNNNDQGGNIYEGWSFVQGIPNNNEKENEFK